MMKITGLPLDEFFFDALATHLFANHPAAVACNDLSSLRVLTPSLSIAAELRTALARRLPTAALMPAFGTLRQWAQIVSLPVVPLPPSRRLVLLYEALRASHWPYFNESESVLWGIAGEIAALFDELTDASVSLPDSVEALAAQLENAYALRASRPLAFEARVIHELWRALAASGEPEMAAAYHLQLAGLLERVMSWPPQSAPVFVLLDATPEEALSAAEYNFYRCYAAHQTVHLVYPLSRDSVPKQRSSLLDVLAAAWPHACFLTLSSSSPENVVSHSAVAPVAERAHALAEHYPHSPLTGRLMLVPTAGREQEAQTVVAQIGGWLQAGLRRIALIAQDRLAARRVRALLEREGVLVSDETGWLLSTSRAAAAINALLETVAGDAYYRDLLDLCKTPYFCADWPENERQLAVFVLEMVIRGTSVHAKLKNFQRALQNRDFADGNIGKDCALAMLDRLAEAQSLLDARPMPLACWISRLREVLVALGMLQSLADDIAGKALLDALVSRQEELAGDTVPFSFSVWRDWLRHEFESVSFRDDRIVSPIVLTPLNATSLRCFEAALLIGGDARRLSPTTHNAFFNQAVRRELGLRTRADGERELRRDLELLLALTPRVVVTWQSVQDGESNLLAPEFLLLSTLHALAWGDDLQRRPLPLRRMATADAVTAPCVPVTPMAVSMPAARLPARVSVSAYACLVACPYRFFARHVLGLGEMDEVREALEKRDYGTLVHRCLQDFHVRCPRVSDLTVEEAIARLNECVDAVFAPAVTENFFALSWRQRWEKRVSSYLDWQRQREAVGWYWAQAETPVNRVLMLADGGQIELYGRIDRIDRNVAEEAALLDYKTQRASVLKKAQQDGDMQLSVYALMHEALEVAYVALDDETVSAIPGNDGHLMALADAQGHRLVTLFDAMRAGAPLPANGADSVCQWCEMRGLCRKVLPA